MQIYLLRHAIAEDGKPGQADRDRALVPEGRKKLKDVLRLAYQADCAISLVLTSPYRRARETADMVTELLAPDAPVVETDTLEPNAQPSDVWGEIRVHQHTDSVLLVGHEPLLSSIMAFFLNSPAMRVEMKKSALVRMDVDSFGAQPHATLRWMITPKIASGA